MKKSFMFMWLLTSSMSVLAMEKEPKNSLQEYIEGEQTKGHAFSACFLLVGAATALSRTDSPWASMAIAAGAGSTCWLAAHVISKNKMLNTVKRSHEPNSETQSQ